MSTITDLIKLHRNGLIIRFAETGEKGHLSVVDLTHGFHHFRLTDSHDIIAQRSESDVLIETFANDKLARQAHDKLCRASHKYLRRHTYTARAKAIILYCIIPLVALLLVINLSTAVMMLKDENTSPMTPTVVPIQTQPIQPSAYVTPPSVSADQLSVVLKKGADKQNFTIARSEGHEEGFYVFSDPQCPHCRNLEPVLDTLANDYNITVFPVSVVGGSTSHNQINNILCSDYDKRASLWASIDSVSSIPNHTVCMGDMKDPALSNNKAFIRANIKYTPTIISTNGNIMPTELEKTEQSIREWLNTVQ